MTAIHDRRRDDPEPRGNGPDRRTPAAVPVDYAKAADRTSPYVNPGRGAEGSTDYTADTRPSTLIERARRASCNVWVMLAVVLAAHAAAWMIGQ